MPRWPWQRRPTVESAPGQPAEPRLDVLITPEPPPEVRAFLEQQLFGRIDRAVDWLDAFLAEHELDNLNTRHVASDLTPEQEARVRAIVGSATPRQAFFNLLLNPQLIPHDLRLAACLAAIRQDADPYLRIAAIAGLQGGAMPDEIWVAVRDALLEAIRTDSHNSVQNRATVTLAHHLRASDGDAVLAAIEDATLGASELTNVVGALAKAGADGAVTALVGRALEQGVAGEQTRAWLADWQVRGSRPTADPPPYLGLPALAYIPNLDE